MSQNIDNIGIYLTLVSQLNKPGPPQPPGQFPHQRTLLRGVQSRSGAFLADKYHLQKLENISGKHLTSYVLWMQESGKSASTIKTVWRPSGSSTTK